MSTPDLQGLQIQPDAADTALAQQQTRFDTLVRDVARWRSALGEWKERLARYHQAIEPVRRELHGAWRQWVFALEEASLQPGLTRGEREQLLELLREAAAALLDVQDDAEIAQVLRRYAEDPGSGQARPDVQGGARSDPDTGDDLAHGWERQAADAAAQRAQRAAQRRAALALKRREQAAQEVSQSLRDVYRRLASSLHPDREPDAQQRARKTTLMQQANQAYADQDLLALLELQLQAEQVDAARAAAADARRLQHYVAVLQEQLTELQAEARRLEAEFRSATGVAPGSGLQPHKADRLISARAQQLRHELLLVQRQTRLLRDVEATRRWLRESRRG